MKTLSERLLKLMEDGALTKRDLQRWLGRPYPTVRLWIVGTHKPWDVWEEEVENKVLALEKLVRERRVLPVPASYSPNDRAELIEDLIDERDARLPRTRSAARR